MQRKHSDLLRTSVLLLAIIFASALLWPLGRISLAAYRVSAIESAVEKWQADAEAQENAKQAEEKTPPEEQAAQKPPGKTPKTDGKRPRGQGSAGPPSSAPEKADVPYAEIRTAGFIGPPMPGMPPPQLTAILGDGAILNGQFVEAGGQIGPAKVIEIHPNKVVVEMNGNRMDLVLFDQIK